MIIWSRWGFLSLLAIGLGVGTAFGLDALTGAQLEGATIGAVIFLFAGIFNLALAYLVYPRLDKPRPVTYTQSLPEPITHANGVVQTHQVLPALDADGKQVWARPTSTLFFVPARLVWVLCLLAALVLGVIGLLG
ncbi:hypothetical protein [Microlunatus ginsengisoli]|uniref:Uncharacterized protein n=1 Tax=Microlunatus ginsengisoli TaxID=363863 RepID=A0ABP7AFT3_9ACTN